LIVKNDQFEAVEGNKHSNVKKDRFEQVEGDQHLTVKGDQNDQVDGAVSRNISMDLQEKTGMKHAVDAGTEIHLKAGMNAVIEANASVTLKSGGSFITINPGGIFIQGPVVMINSGGAAVSGSGSNPKNAILPQGVIEADDAKPGWEAKSPPPVTVVEPPAVEADSPLLSTLPLASLLATGGAPGQMCMRNAAKLGATYVTTAAVAAPIVLADASAYSPVMSDAGTLDKTNSVNKQKTTQVTDESSIQNCGGECIFFPKDTIKFIRTDEVREIITDDGRRMIMGPKAETGMPGPGDYPRKSGKMPGPPISAKLIWQYVDWVKGYKERKYIRKQPGVLRCYDAARKLTDENWGPKEIDPEWIKIPGSDFLYETPGKIHESESPGITPDDLPTPRRGR